MADKRDYSKVKIKHIMADGSVRDSVKGYVTSPEQLPELTKMLIRQIMLGEHIKKTDKNTATV